MSDHKRIYEWLLDYCSTDAVIDSLMIGLVWTVCRNSDGGFGLAMSPGIPTRTLPWSGTLTGKPVTDVASWITSWEPYQATVAMAAINSCINRRRLPESVMLTPPEGQANLAVFDHFLPQLQGKNVVVIGHYPGIECYSDRMQLHVLEKLPVGNDLPDAACEYLVPQADWVFLTASSIPNKTFPRLAELAAGARTVLMGPTVPWLPQWHDFGIDYLAGVEITDADALYRTAAQGGGVRIFSQGLRYRIAELTPAVCMDWLKREIAEGYAEKAMLTDAMEKWYAEGRPKRFPDIQRLEKTSARLSHMDSSYKSLWDRYGTATNQED